MARATIVFVLVWLAAARQGPATPRLPDGAVRAVEAVSADELRSYVGALASDAFRGRGVGDAGNRAAEEFICATLRASGVTPAGAGGSCYQAVDVYRPALGSRPRLVVSNEDGTTLADLSVGVDFYPLLETAAGSVTAPLVYAGHGISAPARKHDDYAGVQAANAIVLIRAGAPDSVSSAGALSETEVTALESVARKIADARAHGARGVLIIGGFLAGYRTVWPESASVRDTDFRLLSELRDSTLAAATLSEKAAAPMLHALEAHRALTASLSPDLRVSPVTMHNVLGMVEGRDDSHRGEMVVLGAHLDHDGIDAEGRIYNGADDNASGTAAVLAAAAAFARAAAAGERPARAVLFAFWNGEEKGSLGAQAFVAAPQPGRHVTANLNLDMVGRHEEVLDPSDWRFHGLPTIAASATGNTLHVLGYSRAPELAALVRAANDAVGLTLQEDYDNGALGLLQRSDQWAFLARGIPALFLTTGLHPDYHTPADDTDRIDFGKLTRVARLAARSAWIVAESPEPALRKR